MGEALAGSLKWAGSFKEPSSNEVDGLPLSWMCFGGALGAKSASRLSAMHPKDHHKQCIILWYDLCPTVAPG